MTLRLKKDTAVTLRFGPFLDETNGKDAETGLTIAATDVKLAKYNGSTGSALAAKNEGTALTGNHDALGYYILKLDATDTNTCGPMRVHCHVAGALPVWLDTEIVAANVWNSTVDASDYLYVDAKEIASDATAASNQAGAATAVIRGTVYNDGATYLPTNSGNLIFYSDDITEATADHYNGRVVVFTSGAMLGQALQISDYEKVASYGKFTCTVATELPADNVTFVVV